jgi:acyl-CoA synthetase (AMP-forming)/AMP-acid ligase II
MQSLLNVSDAVAAQARLQPTKSGARDSRRAISFAQWDERASRLANALLGLGLQPGDRVALLAFNCVEWMEIYVALARAGLVAVPLNFRLVATEIEYIVTHCEARACIVQDDLADRFEAIRRSELERLDPKLAALPPETRSLFDQLTRLMVEKLLIDPTEQLKALPDEETQAAYTEAINRLFRLRGQAGSTEPEGAGDDVTAARRRS